MTQDTAKEPINWTSLLTSLSPEQKSLLFGPREVYDAAYRKDKVIVISYDEVLKMANIMKGADMTHLRLQDVFIVAKIMRRAPPLQDKQLQSCRMVLSRRFMLWAADAGYPEAQLFWSEEVMSQNNVPTGVRDKALKLLTNIGRQAVPRAESVPLKSLRPTDTVFPVSARANHLLGRYLWAAGDLTKTTTKRDECRDRAMQHLERAGEEGHAEAYVYMGVFNRRAGKARMSKRAFEKAHALGSALGTWLLARATSDTKLRTSLLAEAVGLGSHHAAYDLGHMYRKQGQDALAIEYYTMAAEADVQPAQANLAELLVKQGEFDEAEKWFIRASVVRAPDPKKETRTGQDGDISFHSQRRLEQMRKTQVYNDYQRAKQKKLDEGGSCTIM
ncbi:hypothetical protein BCR37DRAFT_386296 [Protomyces lactucae-debilis]|uniref:Uncharacterized protein n=1 Tax=Protomyces lactucae-debilis TaxID=2754530 RepID=A0A1Y2FLW6_PROLT|nr:uncharacterized protein BCR37DRAFT_386296 [Protomyces lactucae-debilis]ORY84963.1 hypothetical protein BCR37DRAFT_386296 [Protomyces lactucae-debilis]